MSKIRVLIADDHTIVREGLSMLLRGDPNIEIVGEAENGEEAVAKVKELKLDVVLMDITMPGIDGFEATRLIKQQQPEVNVLALSVHESEEFFFEALDSGASGYFLKGGSSRDLVSAIAMVAKGDTYLHPLVARKMVSFYLREVKSGSNKESYDHLSERERDILKHIAEGRRNNEIAELLSVSTNTVQAHRARLMIKLGLHNRTDLVRYAIKRGIVSLGS